MVLVQFVLHAAILFHVTCSQYTSHKSFLGGQIDAAALEMWEESVDGSGKFTFLTMHNTQLGGVTHVLD